MEGTTREEGVKNWTRTKPEEKDSTKKENRKKNEEEKNSRRGILVEAISLLCDI